VWAVLAVGVVGARHHHQHEDSRVAKPDVPLSRGTKGTHRTQTCTPLRPVCSHAVTFCLPGCPASATYNTARTNPLTPFVYPSRCMCKTAHAVRIRCAVVVQSSTSLAKFCAMCTRRSPGARSTSRRSPRLGTGATSTVRIQCTSISCFAGGSNSEHTWLYVSRSARSLSRSQPSVLSAYADCCSLSLHRIRENLLSLGQNLVTKDLNQQSENQSCSMNLRRVGLPTIEAAAHFPFVCFCFSPCSWLVNAPQHPDLLRYVSMSTCIHSRHWRRRQDRSIPSAVPLVPFAHWFPSRRVFLLLPF
jgi:hypothetical protein